jgi:proton-dependent oligopeptide transporter, POT family
MMERERHPKGLYILFFTEMWERFSFYLILGILYQYLTDYQKGGMGMKGDDAAVIVGSYQGLVYFTPFIGGLIADRLLGCRRMIVIGGLLMMCGHLVLAWPEKLGLFLGLGLLCLGNGAFKPNISTLVGNLYEPDSPLRDAGYNIFYMGINIGAFICNFVAAIVRNYVDQHPIYLTSGWKMGGWHAAFATAALGMLFGVILFSLNYRRFAKADQDPASYQGPRESLTPLWLQCLVPAAILGTAAWIAADSEAFGPFFQRISFKPPTAAFVGACIPVVVFYLTIWAKIPNARDRGRVAALFVIFAVVVVFWITSMLNTTALTAWTRDVTNRVPSSFVRVFSDRIPDALGLTDPSQNPFSENAPASYYFNANSETPRPSRETFEVVSSDRYKALEKAKELDVQEGHTVYVTQEMLDKIYAQTTASTPTLEPKKHLKLVNTELFSSINPGFIILLTPLIVAFWHFLRARRWEPSTSAKIGLGLIQTGGAAAVMLLATLSCHESQEKSSAWWLFGTYFLITTGELCLSPMGLSLVNKMAPTNLRAFMMGGWFLATSIGNKLSGIFGEVYESGRLFGFAIDHQNFWVVLIVCNLASGIFVLVLLPWLNRQMAGPEE